MGGALRNGAEHDKARQNVCVQGDRTLRGLSVGRRCVPPGGPPFLGAAFLLCLFSQEPRVPRRTPPLAPQDRGAEPEVCPPRNATRGPRRTVAAGKRPALPAV